ncbi:OLC1v1036746C1 [Oldenlandia corymbosa var. corymbosa]|uniref:OLC1v1036746C1 n=1 Tax=Oldenlandia corymbosa var. corymbosa TaxID=529605 RepID=A0AAV1CYS1_OLDCO|nr:OLC1v1036746C1 [Oldenlandia corymbosa var. corymbosa]
MDLSTFQLEFMVAKTPLMLLKNFIPVLIPLILSIIFLCKWLNHTENPTKNLPPSPPRIPIVGNLHQVARLSIPQRGLRALAQIYGPVMRLRLGRREAIVISSAEVAEQILRTNDLIFADRIQPSFVGRLLYDFKDIGFSRYGEYWRQMRLVTVSRLLTTKMVQSFRSLREEEIINMLGSIRESCFSGSTVRINEILARFSNNIISSAAIGKRYSELKNGNRFQELFSECTMICGYSNIADFIPWLGWLNHINGMESKVNRVAKEVDEYLESIVEQGVEKMMSSSSINGGDCKEDKRPQNFLDVLLGLQQENALAFTLDINSIKALILDIILGGTESTYTLLEWAFAELLRNPTSMTKLKDEVRQLSRCKSKSVDMITEEDLGSLPYLKAVIKEALRMHPPAPFLVRQSRKAVKILGYDIAPGTFVYINGWAIGRDIESWERPDEFRPERFLNNSPVDLKGHHFQFLPFGSGRRICPGSAFALVIAELALANLILNFNFELADGKKPEELDMTEAHGLVTIKKTPLLVVASLPN